MTDRVPEAGSVDEQWAFDAGREVQSAPAVADGTVFVDSNDSTVYAVTGR